MGFGFGASSVDLGLVQRVWASISRYILPHRCCECILLYMCILLYFDTCILVYILLSCLYNFDLGLLCVFIKFVCQPLFSYYSTLSLSWVFSYYETLCAFWGHKFSYSVADKTSFFGNKGLRVQASGLWAAY